MRPLLLALSLLASVVLTGCPNCPHPAPWVPEGPITEAQRAQALYMVDVAKATLHDRLGYLECGGTILFVEGPYAADGYCYVPPPYHVSGCAYDPIIVLLWTDRGLGPDLLRTALSHELCDTAAGGEQAGTCDNDLNAATPPLSYFEALFPAP